VEEPHFDREALIAEVAKRHKILLHPDDPAFALITINEIVLSRAIGIVEARLKEMEQSLAQISVHQTETAKAIGEAIITAGAAYVAKRIKDAGADLMGCPLRCSYCHKPDSWHLKEGTSIPAQHVIDCLAGFASARGALDGGLTISGGDPLVQIAFTRRILSAAKKMALTRENDGAPYPLCAERSSEQG
jgi:sulfatase maturation enzyme AslB (radical SAM superfamily)